MRMEFVSELLSPFNPAFNVCREFLLPRAYSIEAFPSPRFLPAFVLLCFFSPASRHARATSSRIASGFTRFNLTSTHG